MASTESESVMGNIGIRINGEWICIETYSWACSSLRRSIVKRDIAWFTKIRTDIDLFWKEVVEVREGRRILEPAKKRRVEPEVELGYSFVDD
jgi:hypothetical protein